MYSPNSFLSSEITLFLYGIGARFEFFHKFFFIALHYSYMELEQISIPLTLLFFLIHYIIPIWNWSAISHSLLLSILWITLFLYGIGARYVFFASLGIVAITLFLYGIGAKFSNLFLWCCLIITLFLYGIGACITLVHINSSIYDYIIPIWNWS